MTATRYDTTHLSVNPDGTLEGLPPPRTTTPPDIDNPEPAPGPHPLDNELTDDDLAVPVVPMRHNEFHCNKCFLVRLDSQRSQLGSSICHDCL
jgi:hypothetical protein